MQIFRTISLTVLLAHLIGCANTTSSAPQSSPLQHVGVSIDNYDGPYYYQQEKSYDYTLSM